MKFKPFSKDEIIFNTIKAHPKVTFTFADGETYLNNISSSNSNVPNGNISAYDLSVNRTGDERIYQFLNKDSDFASFKTTGTSSYSSALYGTEYKTYLPLTSSIQVEYGADLTHTTNLKNIINYYRFLSKYFDFDTYFDGQAIKLISIPSIFYGSSMKRGSFALNYYYTGSLVAVVEDSENNGVLIETTGSSVGSVAGIALYNEGFIALFGTASLGPGVVETTGYTSGNTTGSLIDFGDTKATVLSSSFELEFKGTTFTPTMTMFAHAGINEYNFSTNPTFISGNFLSGTQLSGNTTLYNEPSKTIKNITKSPYSNTNADFVKTTYISKVAIYDNNKQLLGIAHLAEPIKKTEDLAYTFKIRLDL
jgi:hypothetical protein